MRYLRIALATAVLLVSVWAAVLISSENRFLHAAITAIATTTVLAFSWQSNRLTRLTWLMLALVFIAFGVAGFHYHSATEGTCTARDAAGRRVIVGTELTDWGKTYVASNPSDGPNEIMEALGSLEPKTAWTIQSIQRCELQVLLTGVLLMPFVGAALACALALVRIEPLVTAAKPAKKNVFISYNHADAAVALRLREALSKQGLAVTIDREHMAAGEPIYDFIERSIHASDAVVSVVSSQSLLSSWVALETLSACQRQKWVKGKVFIGALLDQELFHADFRLKCTETIDQRLEQIDKTIAEYRGKKIDPIDLNDEKTRLFNLRNDLGSILATLKGSLCVDLSDEHFAASCQKLVQTINDAGSAVTPL